MDNINNNKHNHKIINWNEKVKVFFIDRFLAKYFLILLPKKVTPNQITMFRLLSVPFIFYFFISGDYIIGTIFFIFSAFSDALDGALARTTKQVTEWGIVYDPIADKLLIGVVAILIISKFMNSKMAFIIIFLEVCLVVLNHWRHQGEIIQAKMSGKIKMFLQCMGIIFLLFYVLSGWPFFYIFSQILLFLAICFAFVSLFVYYSI